MEMSAQSSNTTDQHRTRAKERSMQKDDENKLKNSLAKQEKAFLALRRAQMYVQPVLMAETENPSLLISCEDGLEPVTFVSIDIEAFEFNQKWITEVGVSTLNTNALVGLEPGPKGEAWVPLIEGKHFRIWEYKSRVNKKFVEGCPDKFNFGVSEWIYENQIGTVVNEILGAQQHDQTAVPSAPRVILVGHNVLSDIKYLESLGINVRSSVSDCIDTDDLFKATRRDVRSASLSKVLAQHEIPAKNLHNAGNDAFYTLQALLAIAVDDLTNPVTEAELELRKQERIRIACEEATKRVNQEFDTWNKAAGQVADMLTPEDLLARAQMYSVLVSPHSPKATISTTQGAVIASPDIREPYSHRPHSTAHPPRQGRGSAQEPWNRGHPNVRRGSRGSSSFPSRGERGGRILYNPLSADFVPFRGGYASRG